MSKDIVDWEDLSPEDQNRVNEMLSELNEIFDSYAKKDEECEDSISED